MLDEQRARIRALNDQLRQGRIGGRLCLTGGVLGLGDGAVAEALDALARFDEFTDANDPYGEHDFGCIVVQGERLFWKIDYYDGSLTSHAVDPADAAKCVRVLTVMLAREY